MSTPTFEAIQTVTVTNATQAALEFTSIPGRYTDLRILVSCRTNNTAAGNGFDISLNGSTSNFSNRGFYGAGNGTEASFSNATGRGIGFVNGSNDTASTFGNTDIYIPDYTAATNKYIYSTTVQEGNAAQIYMGLQAVKWADTAAITSISLTPQLGSWVQYTTGTLYGILKQ